MKIIYKQQINIVEWTRDWITLKARENFQNTCFLCEAGSLQWIMTEKERFKPCVILPEEENLEFSKKEFMDNINKSKEIDWKMYYNKTNTYCHAHCQDTTDFCDRIRVIGDQL